MNEDSDEDKIVELVDVKLALNIDVDKEELYWEK